MYSDKKYALVIDIVMALQVASALQCSKIKKK